MATRMVVWKGDPTKPFFSGTCRRPSVLGSCRKVLRERALPRSFLQCLLQVGCRTQEIEEPMSKKKRKESKGNRKGLKWKEERGRRRLRNQGGVTKCFWINKTRKGTVKSGAETHSWSRCSFPGARCLSQRQSCGLVHKDVQSLHIQTQA